MKNKGTALLVTILLAGAIGSIAFAIFRIASSEIFVGTKGEEGVEAYYAAQAGVDDALMRYKFKDSGKLEIPLGAYEKSNQVLRVDVNDENADNQAFIAKRDYDNVPVASEDKYIYDLKVWHKKEGDYITELGKDESVLLDVTDAARGSDYVFVRWRVLNGDRSATHLWYRLMDPLGNSRDPRLLSRDFFTYLASYDDVSPIPGVRPLRGGFPKKVLTLHGFSTLKFKVFSTDPNIKIQLLVGPYRQNELIGGPNTYIESTGYYGNTARRIKVTIDRASKSVMDIFDYVIYSPQDPLP